MYNDDDDFRRILRYAYIHTTYPQHRVNRERIPDYRRVIASGDFARKYAPGPVNSNRDLSDVC